MQLADRHGLAVVNMNQVTTKVMPGGGAKMVPALGACTEGAACSVRAGCCVPRIPLWLLRVTGELPARQ